ncbi:LOW QUALITY PROTEIN: hypothetical protein BC936DRAFT_140024 [Jimgerdemannia flammicorona]|uniref:Fatty acid hydroxylase domain-containing protein n=1 Tax=Jimgerdemannia flammicorona TaxID=994334 RepID=A0A433B682_9FUNG|nr:LOW QUALITY PROTEIN: hypothetical protein BC936DRAFT_140024 [Jimgerdemannia flammicorona]
MSNGRAVGVELGIEDHSLISSPVFHPPSFSPCRRKGLADHPTTALNAMTTAKPVATRPSVPTPSALTLILTNLKDSLVYLTVLPLFFLVYSTPTFATFYALLVQTFSRQTIFLQITFLLTFASYWIHCLLLSLPDLHHLPQWITKRKIQPAKTPSLEWYAKAAKSVLFNQIVVSAAWGAVFYKLAGWRGMQCDAPLPSVAIMVRDFLVFVVVEEIGFYYGHRLLHHSAIYKYVHKMHHEFTAPVAIAAIYCHPVEHILSNLLPLFAGPLLMRSHLVTFWLWSVIAQFNAVNSHCGYRIPFLPSPLQHDYHHQVFNANFGVLGWLDRMHGTQGGFDAWECEYREREKRAVEGRKD